MTSLKEIKTFNTEMGSLAFQEIYDLLEIIDANRYDSSTPLKDMPVSVRRSFPKLEESMGNIEKETSGVIVDWLNSVVERQDGNRHDAEYIDELLGGRLTQEGLMEKIVYPQPQQIHPGEHLEAS